DQSFKWNIIKECWQKLVYPWGVSSLSADDDNFHPFHLTNKYPKDAAYHTGTIWLWLNGIAMQRMIESGQAEIAYQLFKNMNQQALNRGVVGGLGENMDAYPHKDKTWPRPTGTYLQAWSNAEHLRVWYQYFLGIRPDMANNKLTLAPRLPKGITNLDYDFIIGDQRVKAGYQASDDRRSFQFRFGNDSLTATINIFPYQVKQINIKPNSTLNLTASGDSLNIELKNKNGESIHSIISPKSQSRLDLRKKQNAVLKYVHFAQPKPLSEIPVMSK
ncbi:MAG TPA: amylo-alpha-1,6-glucosidase, partial [Balneolaceae bacterium]|nr:amylo-alpha-1,6-glucosidase [Balneolaceae bacterium]